ncbi:hypothetical protein Hamer_G004403 [Homarus americanus]|uniref:Uncharacterized protein n=1 Tax=Homarus americanus TaxID=6706 RepID=A0A8J5JY86_HOMAM|nr:hypothetical protein Hamer_G004403 [Homarus americanus]
MEEYRLAIKTFPVRNFVHFIRMVISPGQGLPVQSDLQILYYSVQSKSVETKVSSGKPGGEVRENKQPATQCSASKQNLVSPFNKELINDMIVPLLHQWTKANALFKPPVINQCRTIELKLTKLWHKAVETSLGKGNLARKNEFLHTLDTLFDILTCKCSIQLCSESNCSHSGKRENNSHIDCGCPREKKIPVLELEFIKAQRTKAEGQGSMQMGSIDYSETKKQIANAKKREQIREREQKKKMKSEEAIQREEELCQDVYHFFDIPPINVNATKLSELVDLSLEVLEPPLTTSLTSQELRNLKETPMQVPKWPSHTQSVERCVKMVTEAAGHVYSHERREESTQGCVLLDSNNLHKDKGNRTPAPTDLLVIGAAGVFGERKRWREERECWKAEREY